MRTRAVCGLLVLCAAATLAASASGGGRSGGLTIPAPAVGKSQILLLKLKVSGASGYKNLKVRVTNLAQLGKGFGAVAVVAGPKKPGATATYEIEFVMFMGNLSTNPAKTVDLALTPARTLSGGHVTFLKEGLRSVTNNCEGLQWLNGAFETDHSDTIFWGPNSSDFDAVWLEDLVGHDQSKPEAFVDNMVSYLWGKCPGKPEAFDSDD